MNSMRCGVEALAAAAASAAEAKQIDPHWLPGHQWIARQRERV